jgi:hypothetical protein
MNEIKYIFSKKKKEKEKTVNKDVGGAGGRYVEAEGVLEVRAKL